MAATATKKKTATGIKLQPLGDRVVVEREESGTKTAGGILLPDSAKDKPARGVVVSVGEGKLTNAGKRQALQVKPGDRVAIHWCNSIESVQLYFACFINQKCIAHFGRSANL